jgi:hypothetical protein
MLVHEKNIVMNSFGRAVLMVNRLTIHGDFNDMSIVYRSLLKYKDIKCEMYRTHQGYFENLKIEELNTGRFIICEYYKNEKIKIINSNL